MSFNLWSIFEKVVSMQQSFEEFLENTEELNGNLLQIL